MSTVTPKYGEFAASDGVAVTYAEMGEGMPLFAPLGYGATIEAVCLGVPFYTEAAKAGFRIIIPETRGFGKTPLTPNAGLKRTAMDMRELMEHLNIEQAYVYAGSMGAAITFEYIRKYGCDRLSGILICDMTAKLVAEGDWSLGIYQGNYSRKQYEADLKLMEHNFKEWGAIFGYQACRIFTPSTPRNFTYTPEMKVEAAKLMGMDETAMDAMLEALWSEERKDAYITYWKSMVEADYRDVPKKITVPTVLVYANPGSLYSPLDAAYMLSQIPHASIHLPENSTHANTGASVEWIKELIH